MSNRQIIYKRRITAFERMLIRIPYAIVTMVARIKGEISEQNLNNAILKIQQRHTYWFTITLIFCMLYFYLFNSSYYFN